jgi:thioredoxin reductase (NADPH)
MTTDSYDVIVIGAGPAGLTAATEAARAGLRALCLEKLAPGGVLINLGDLHDFDEIWNGPDMAARLTDDATVADVELGFGEVTGLLGEGPWTIKTAEGESYTARAVVIATGLKKGTLGLPNEAEFEGRGISHCAHCDGPLYAGLPVVVAGADGWAGIEAQELVGLAGEVTVVDASAAKTPAGIRRVAGRIVALEGNDGLRRRRGGWRANERSGQCGVRPCRPVSRCGIPAGIACAHASGHIVVMPKAAPRRRQYRRGRVRAGARH